jgi:hypothetical protein
MAIPNIVNVLMITALFFLIFMILGVNFFKGLLYYCNTSAFSNFDDSILGKYYYYDINLDNKWDCINYGAEWMKKDLTFDTMKEAFIMISMVSQAFSWSSIMYDIMWSRGIDLIPRQYSNMYASLYFVGFIIIGSFFITNLFVGVVVSTYNREKERLGSGFILTKE